MSADIVHLNVGGKYIDTTRATLTSDRESFFHAMFMHEHEMQTMEQDENGRYFIDANPKLFAIILDHLRGYDVRDDIEELRQGMKKRLLQDVHFYQITSMFHFFPQHLFEDLSLSFLHNSALTSSASANESTDHSSSEDNDHSLTNGDVDIMETQEHDQHIDEKMNHQRDHDKTQEVQNGNASQDNENLNNTRAATLEQCVKPYRHLLSQKDFTHLASIASSYAEPGNFILYRCDLRALDTSLFANLNPWAIKFVQFVDCDMRGMNFEGFHFQVAYYFENSDLQLANFSNCELGRRTIISFQNSNLQHANFENTNFMNVDLRNANIQNAHLRNASFRGGGVRNLSKEQRHAASSQGALLS